MSIGPRQSDSKSGTGTSVTFGLGSLPIQGNTLLAIIHTDTDSSFPTITPPSGWTSLGAEILNFLGNPDKKIEVFWKSATGSGFEQNAQFNFSLSVGYECHILEYEGTTQPSPIDASGHGQDGAASTSHTASAVTTTVPNCQIIGIWGNGSVTPPASMTTTIPGSFVTIAEQSQAAAGSSGNKTATTAFSTLRTWFLLALKPNQPPSTPGTPTITGDVSGTTTDRLCSVGWTASTDPESNPIEYQVELSLNNGSTWEILGTVTTNAASFDTTSKTATTQAKVRVIAIDSLGNASGYATSASFTIEHHPNTPVLLTPNAAGIVITVGTVYPITWQPPTDPNSTSGQIVTIVDFSDNGGSTWNNITTTSGGAASHNWNTTGRTPGTHYKIRIQHRDELNLLSAQVVSANEFEIRADATPSAPSNLHAEQPNGTTVTVADRAQTIRIAYTFVDPGDVQSAHRFEWGTDGVSYPNDSGFLSTANQFKDYPGTPTFGDQQIYFRITTKDNAGNASPSATFNFRAANLPATPNITAPTAVSPPTNARPTVTWTSSGQAAYQLRIKNQAGTIIYDSGKVISTSTSHATTGSNGVDLANNTQYTCELRIWNAADLPSAFDSETVTVSYTGPAVPTLLITVEDNNRRIKAEVQNSDTPVRNEIWAYNAAAGSSTAIRIKSDLVVDGIFYYRHAKHLEDLKFFARAFDSNGLFTDSVHSSAVHQTLQVLTINCVDDADTVVPIQLLNEETSRGFDYQATLFQADGRTLPFAEFGQITTEEAIHQAVLFDSLSDYENIKALADKKRTLCVRDKKNAKGFYILDSLPVVETLYGQTVTLTFRRVEYKPSGNVSKKEEEV